MYLDPFCGPKETGKGAQLPTGCSNEVLERHIVQNRSGKTVLFLVFLQHL